MPLSVSRASARFYTKDSVLAVELPVESEAERGERERREATPSASSGTRDAYIHAYPDTCAHIRIHIHIHRYIRAQTHNP